MSANEIEPGDPSPWLLKHLPQFQAGGQLLDLACGRGRHTRYLLDQGFDMMAVDVNISGVEDLRRRCTIVQADLECNAPWPLKQQFDGVLVFNYLYRPGLDDLLASIRPGGLLLYETFMIGNEDYGRPSNPNFLLQKDELRHLCKKAFNILDFRQGLMTNPGPAITQSICARKQV